MTNAKMTVYENYDFTDGRVEVSTFQWNEDSKYENILSTFTLMLKLKGKYTIEVKIITLDGIDSRLIETYEDRFGGRVMANAFNAICTRLGLVA